MSPPSVLTEQSLGSNLRFVHFRLSFHPIHFATTADTCPCPLRLTRRLKSSTIVLYCTLFEWTSHLSPVSRFHSVPVVDRTNKNTINSSINTNSNNSINITSTVNLKQALTLLCASLLVSCFLFSRCPTFNLLRVNPFPSLLSFLSMVSTIK